LYLTVALVLAFCLLFKNIKLNAMNVMIEEVMNNFPVLVDQDTSIIEVFKIFRQKKVSHLLLVEGSTLVGVLSKEDLLNQMVELAADTTGKNYNEIILKSTMVKRIMSTNLVVARTGELLLEVVRRMLDAKVHCIPIINDLNEPIGILNPIDLLSALAADKKDFA
jgi:CBS domain-containing protein